MPNWSSCTAVFATSLDAIQYHSLIHYSSVLLIHILLLTGIVDFIEQCRNQLPRRLNLVVSDKSCTILLPLATTEPELICKAHATK